MSWEKINKVLEQEFSPEITDEEAMLFLYSHPDKEWSLMLLVGYKIFIQAGRSPYEALKSTMKSYVETMEE